MSCKLYLILAVVGIWGTLAVKDRHGGELETDTDVELEEQSVAHRAALLALMAETKPQQNEAFAKADANSDGKISLDDLKKLNINTPMALLAIRAFDTDFDGMINAHELFNAPIRPPPYVHFKETSADGKASQGNGFWSPSCLSEMKKYWQWVAKVTRETETTENAKDGHDIVATVAKEAYKNSVRNLGYQRPYTPTQDLCQSLLKFQNLVDMKDPMKWMKWQFCDTKTYAQNVAEDPVGNMVTGIATTNKDRERAAKRIDDYFVGQKADC